MSSLNPQDNPSGYWRSLNELADTAEFRAFVESEFPAIEGPVPVSRRKWLQLMSASLALAGVGGCRWEKEEILPFAKRPAERVPGRPQQFATAMDLAGSAEGLLVTCVDGRPIKIEGNPAHPGSNGATTPLAQAALLELYDPQRSQGVRKRSGEKDFARTWDSFTSWAGPHFEEFTSTDGAGFRVLAEADSSPTLAALRADLLKLYPNAQWHEFEPISRENERDGARLALGQPVRTHLALDAADVIVCLDDDLLGSHSASIRYARDFAAGREPESGRMNRLYAVESSYSITGAAADHRLALRSGQIAAVVAGIEGVLSGSGESAGFTPEAAHFLEAMIADLKEHAGSSVVTAGAGQPAEVHAAIRRINALLKNVGKTVTYTVDPDPERPSHVESIGSLAVAMAAGEVNTLLIIGGNPVYDAPADVDFAAALAKVPTTIHLSTYRNETTAACTWQLARCHPLESWGDARSYDGTYTVVQPLVAPLFDGRSAIEVLGMILSTSPAESSSLISMSFSSLRSGPGMATWPDAMALVRQTFEQITGEIGIEDVGGLWRKTLHDGLLEGSRWPAAELAADGASGSLGSLAGAAAGDYEIVFCRDASVYDGRFAENGWLQEMPDPITRLTWDNAAVISPATAESLGVKDGSIVKLGLAGREIEIPVCILPGVATGTLAVSLGYGRTAAGFVGDGVGVDVYKLRTTGALGFAGGVSVEPTGRKIELATTQDHFAIDTAGMNARQKRVGSLVQEATLGRFEEFAGLSPEEREHVDVSGHEIHHPPLVSLWEEPPFGEADHRWAMSIDLSKCIGCGACVVSCQAENNIPVVGREQIINGRQMHWIRVDRYFRGDPADPEVVLQPVACHHCEMAPCEQVCPVAATVHSEEGLNDMAYNRCVGTRYCANNCPYKVRRFNYFNYHKDLKDPASEVAKLKYNPEVTVRSRGVMEKCSYCVQRIQAVKIEAKNARRPIADGEIKTACQQVCPTGAIVFGDLGPPGQKPEEQSKVRQAHEAVRSYAMLAALNIKPRTAYLARIRNPNPALEKEAHSNEPHS